MRNGVAVIDPDGSRRWVEWQEPAVDDALFPEIGRGYEEQASSSAVWIGAAECRAVRLDALVDYAVGILESSSV